MLRGLIGRKRLGIPLIVTLCVLLFPDLLIAHAEEEEKVNEMQETKGAVTLGADSFYRFLPAAKANAQPGKVGIQEAGAQYSYEFKAFGKLPVELSLENSYKGIENSTRVNLPAHLVGLITDIELTMPFFNFENTYFRLGVSPSFLGDDWDFPASTFRIPSRYYIIYRPNTKWTFVAGAAYLPEFKDEVLPIVAFIYKPNDRLSFNITPDRPNVSYAINDRVTLFAEGGGSFGEYEVKRDSQRRVVLEYREIRAGCGMKYKVNKLMQASLQAGGAFGRRLEYRDNLGKVEIKNGFYTECRLEISI